MSKKEEEDIPRRLGQLLKKAWPQFEALSKTDYEDDFHLRDLRSCIKI